MLTSTTVRSPTAQTDTPEQILHMHAKPRRNSRLGAVTRYRHPSADYRKRARSRSARSEAEHWLVVHTARNFAMFANEGGVYDDLLDYMRAHRIA